LCVGRRDCRRDSRPSTSSRARYCWSWLRWRGARSEPSGRSRSAVRPPRRRS
jgi:hypothetical protein